MGIIFYSSVVLVWIFNTRSVYNFINKKVHIPVNLVRFFNNLSSIFCRLLKSGVKNELKKKVFSLKEQKSQGCSFKTGKNFAANKTLVWSAYVWRTASYLFLKSNMWCKSSFQSNSLYLKKWQYSMFFFSSWL